MPRKLHLALHDGFDGDSVVVRLNGDPVLELHDARTDYRIGVAHAVEVEQPEGPSTVEFELPERGISGSIMLEQSGDTFLGVSVLEDEVRFRVSDGPFLYA